MTATDKHPPADSAPLTAAPAGIADMLRRLRALVLLAGTVRASGLIAGIRRSILDLPISADRNLLQHWLGHVAALARFADVPQLLLRILLDPVTPAPQAPVTQGPVLLQVERDPLEFRGVGGVLHDITLAYEDDDYILVANATQLLLDPLPALVERLIESSADIAFLVEPDGAPTGIMLIRCRALREIAPIGFVDLKEQALPAIARKHTVTAVRAHVEARSVRTLESYIHAVRQFHRQQHNATAYQDPFAEDWQPTFSLVERLARVDAGAYLHDAVILDGGMVEAGASVVRSVVCPGATVRAGVTVLDQVVAL